MSTAYIGISDIVRRERNTPAHMVELYTQPRMAPSWDPRGAIVRITADTVQVLLEPIAGESDAERVDLSNRLTVDSSLIVAVRLLVLA